MSMNNNMGERLCANKDLYVTYSNSPKKQKIKDKEIKDKLNKIKKNRIQTIIVIAILILVIIFAIIAIAKVTTSAKIELTDDTIFTTLDVSKYKDEILAMYNREGQAEIFEKEMDRIQGQVGTYLIENMTISNKDLENLISDVNKELKKDVWTNIVTNKSTYYIGKYFIDTRGNLKFKFEDKAIEPNWINDENVSKYIILN